MVACLRTVDASRSIRPAAAFLGIFLFLPLAIPLVIPYVRDDFAACLMRDGESLFGAGYYAFSTVSVTLLFFARQSGLIRSAIGVFVAYLILVNLVLMPRIGKLMGSSVREAAVVASRFPRAAMWGHTPPSFNFYAQKGLFRCCLASGDLRSQKKTRLAEVGAHGILYEKLYCPCKIKRVSRPP